MSDALPAAQFTTRSVPRRDRYEVWRHLIAAVFEPTLPNGHAGADLRAEARVASLGNALVVRAIAEAQHFRRSQRLIATEGLDHYLVQVYRSGRCHGAYGEENNIIYPGDIKIIDLGRPFHSFNTDFDNITLTIPRTIMAPLLADPDGLHGKVLHRDTPQARVLAAHIEALDATAADLSPADASAVGAATLRLVAACLGPARQIREEAAMQVASATSHGIRQFIDRNLTDADLSPEWLAKQFNLSRAQLYRLFPNEGGVHAYIRTQRLRRCFQAIADPANRARAIGEIALSFGFVSEAHFSRLFRQTFGINATDARARSATPPPAGAHSFISDWFRQLGRDPEQPAVHETDRQAI